MHKLSFAAGSLAASLWACGPKTPAPETLAIAPGAPPILPAPDASLYSLGESVPADPLVARVVEHGLLPWQEGLAGGATTLALDTAGPLDLTLAGHAARRAGYPYPVVRIITGEEPAGTYPAGLIDTTQRILKLGDHVGVVRARVDNLDRWVVLLGRPAGIAEPFSRVANVDEQLVLNADRPATWQAVSPAGIHKSGPAPTELKLDEPGEWWVQMDTHRGEAIIAVPIFVGMDPPPGPILELPGEVPAGTNDAVRTAYEDLEQLREAFALPILENDGTLTSLASHPLGQRIEETWTREAGEARLQAAGFVGGPVAQVSCQAATVASCLDSLLTDASGRAALLHPQMRLVGVAAQASTDGVVLIVNLASE